MKTEAISMDLLGQTAIQTCPSCQAPSFLVYEEHDPPWAYCCACRHTDSVAALAGKHMNRSRQERILYWIAEYARWQWLRRGARCGLSLHLGIGGRLEDPTRLTLHNKYLGCMRLEELRALLQLNRIRMARSAVRRRGEALIMPICTVPGRIIGFYVLDQEQDAGCLMRTRFREHAGWVFMNVRPTATVMSYDSAQEAVHQAGMLASIGINVNYAFRPRWNPEYAYDYMANPTPKADVIEASSPGILHNTMLYGDLCGTLRVRAEPPKPPIDCITEIPIP